jgi:putative cell wall-binding protein
VYLASGKNFPDALSGAALAGLNKAPLYIVPGECVPASVLADITAFGASKVRILGGTAAVSVDLNNMTICS